MTPPHPGPAWDGGMEAVREQRTQWHGREVKDVAEELGVDPGTGLPADEVARRRAEHGPNQLAAGEQESGFQAFLRQYGDFMQVILLVAAGVNQVFTGDAGTTVLLVGLTVFNAVVGLRQESKAEESVKALARMM